MIVGLHHTGLSVRDLDRAIAFYSAEQAFTVTARFALADNATNRALLQVDHAGAEVAFLKGTLGCLELFQFAQRPEADAGKPAVYAAGIRHICLQGDLTDTLFDGMVAAGASAHARPSGLGTGNSYAYLRDPEANIIEVEGVPWAPATITRPWFAHTATVSPAIDRLADFYATLTGVEVHRRGSFGPDRKFDLVGGLENARFHGAWIRLANVELEFWQYLAPETLPVSKRDMAAPGWNHLCFESDDIAADHARLSAAGVELHSAPHDFGNAVVFFGRDPDGNVFEILQPKPQLATTTVASLLDDDDGQTLDVARRAFRDRPHSPSADPGAA